MLARDLQLVALLRDLAEQAGVLDRQGRLGGEGLQQVDHLRRRTRPAILRETARLPRHASFAQQRYRQQRTEPGFARSAAAAAPCTSRSARRSGIWTGARVAAARPVAPSPTRSGVARSALDQLLREAIGRAQPELAARVVVRLVDQPRCRPPRAAPRASRSWRAPPAGRASSSPPGSPPPASAAAPRSAPARRVLRLQLLEQAHVLDGDHRLVGEGLARSSICFSENGRTARGDR